MFRPSTELPVNCGAVTVFRPTVADGPQNASTANELRMNWRIEYAFSETEGSRIEIARS